MTELQNLHLRICSMSVFRSLLEKPLFSSFLDYCESDAEAKKRRAYGAFVNEIYKLGGDLSNAVRTLLYADENVYVKSVGKSGCVCDDIERTAEFELGVLSRFASLTPAEFALDMNTSDFIPSFTSGRFSLSSEYEKRLNEISKYGYGIFAANAMFYVSDNGEIEPVASPDTISLDDFIGYEQERGKVIANTEAFLKGKAAANVLLYGDAGTGKSSSVKAITNRYFESGLRLIEIRKNQLLLLPKVMGKISDNPLKFIIFIDDLSFNQNDDSFSMLKATLEGSACAKAKNAVIYATSNRRHIVKESFSDRDGDDVHINDTMQENLSLSERFGLTVLFARPEKKLYLEIVRELGAKHGVKLDSQELERQAEAFALKRGNRSARCAEQFIESLT